MDFDPTDYGSGNHAVLEPEPMEDEEEEEEIPEDLSHPCAAPSDTEPEPEVAHVGHAEQADHADRVETPPLAADGQHLLMRDAAPPAVPPALSPPAPPPADEASDNESLADSLLDFLEGVRPDVSPTPDPE